MGAARGEEDDTTAAFPAAHLITEIVQKLETEPPQASGIVFMSGDSADVPSPTCVLRLTLSGLAGDATGPSGTFPDNAG